jgi:hypothetical protein
VKLDRDFQTDNPVKVIVTFLEHVASSSQDALSVNDFSFLRSQKNLENLKGSLSDVVIEERRSDL